MESVQLKASETDAIDIAKLAFEYTSGIKTYYQERNYIIGKTGAGLGSYGEKVIVECQNAGGDNSQTVMTVSGEKEVSTNITANPDKYVRRFVSNIHNLKDRPMSEIVELADQHMTANGTKEVTDSSNQSSGNWLMYVVFAMVFVFMIMMMSSI
ncbi:hypothetical protein [Halostella pelagica]|uniref:hypothetical protein n=1 Tax=Halostella pelagica TaxID=2583824 RepID=UPI001081D497|nr:hypothetical protein [Halostella pelagica]